MTKKIWLPIIGLYWLCAEIIKDMNFNSISSDREVDIFHTAFLLQYVEWVIVVGILTK